MRTSEGNEIHRIIRTRVGAAEAISSPCIAQELRWKPSREREVRRIISDESHLWSNILVCSIPGKGYFCADTFEEAESYNNWLSDLVDQAKNKSDAFRTACEKMGFRFTPKKVRRAA
jgi:hypothetical protein